MNMSGLDNLGVRMNNLNGWNADSLNAGWNAPSAPGGLTGWTNTNRWSNKSNGWNNISPQLNPSNGLSSGLGASEGLPYNSEYGVNRSGNTGAYGGPVGPANSYGLGLSGPTLGQAPFNPLNSPNLNFGNQLQTGQGLGSPYPGLTTGYGAGIAQNPFSNIPPLAGLQAPTLSGLGLNNNFRVAHGAISSAQLPPAVSTGQYVHAPANAAPVQYMTKYVNKIVPDHKLLQQNQQEIHVKKVVEKYQLADTKEVVKNFKRTEYIPTIKYMPIEVTDQRTETVPIARTFERVRNVPTVSNHIKTTKIPSYKTIQVPVRVAHQTTVAQPTCAQAHVQQLIAPPVQYPQQQIQQSAVPIGAQYCGAPNLQQIGSPNFNAQIALPNYNNHQLGINPQYNQLNNANSLQSDLNCSNLGNIQGNIGGQYL